MTDYKWVAAETIRRSQERHEYFRSRNIPHVDMFTAAPVGNSPQLLCWTDAEFLYLMRDANNMKLKANLDVTRADRARCGTHYAVIKEQDLVENKIKIEKAKKIFLEHELNKPLSQWTGPNTADIISDWEVGVRKLISIYSKSTKNLHNRKNTRKTHRQPKKFHFQKNHENKIASIIKHRSLVDAIPNEGPSFIIHENKSQDVMIATVCYISLAKVETVCYSFAELPRYQVPVCEEIEDIIFPFMLLHLTDREEDDGDEEILVCTSVSSKEELLAAAIRDVSLETSTIVRNSLLNHGNAGKGLFAGKDFVKGELVAWFGGVLVAHQDAKFLDPTYMAVWEHNVLVLDGRDMSTARGHLINSVHPMQSDAKQNVRFDLRKKTVVRDMPMFPIFAKRDIRAGEEFVTNYGTGYWRHLKEFQSNLPKPTEAIINRNQRAEKRGTRFD